MPSLSSAALAIAISLASYLQALCMTEPNPPPAKLFPVKSDRIAFIAGSLHKTARRSITVVSLYHALLALYYPFSPENGDTMRPHPLCSQPANLSADLFTWSPVTVACLLSMFFGAAIRLFAFAGLGRSFTFRLSVPEKLVTTGIYQFIQHPSYTGLVLLTVPGLWLVFGWNASAACFIGEKTLTSLRGWEPVVPSAIITGMTLFIVLRVRDEEKLLKSRFGSEWIAWHRKTKRFIPGIF